MDNGFRKPNKQRIEGEDSIIPPVKCYLKALPLQKLEDVEAIISEIKSGNILVIKVTSLAEKSIDDVKRAVKDLTDFVNLAGGDIARLGEERIVITPPWVKIQRPNVELHPS